MKKVLLSMIAAAAVVSANAQTRLVLYEEFSGENCGPCAAANPTLNANIAANATKTILLKYQSPIPSAGPIYNQNTADVQSRMTYYSINSAPSGRADGATIGTGHVNTYNQAAIDAAYAVPTPFTITATHAWSVDGTTITINVSVTSATPFTGSQMKLRAALVEHLEFDSPPGSNGETDFHNVMRKMYPSPTGTVTPNTWTAGQTETYTITGTVPNYVDKSDDETFVIVWLQDDANKVIAQSTKTAPALLNLDVKSEGVAVPNALVCAATNASVVPTVTIKNTGTTTLTAADIYTKVDNGAWTLAQAWTGSLASGATAPVALTAASLAPGNHFIQDSVAMPNGSADINLANNWSYTSVAVSSTVENPLNITTGFENGGQLPANYILYDANGNNSNWLLANGSTGNIGHNNSQYVIYHNNYTYLSGEANYAIIPAADLAANPIRTLDFWVAHATYQTEADKLEIVYSTNCGSSWTSVWSQQGAALQTAPATTSPYVPTQAHWQERSVQVSTIPTGAMIAFRATSAYGNNLFIDDINLRPGSPAGVEEFTSATSNMSLYPNPASDQATLSFVLDHKSDVQVQVVDAVGRTVSVVANGSMAQGSQELTINTANLAAGMYNVVIKTDAGTVTQRLTVAK